MVHIQQALYNLYEPYIMAKVAVTNKRVFNSTLEPAQTQFQLPSMERMRYQYYANGTLLIHPGIGHLIIGCRVSQGYSPNLVVPHGESSTSRFGSAKNYGAPRGLMHESRMNTALLQ